MFTKTFIAFLKAAIFISFLGPSLGMGNILAKLFNPEFPQGDCNYHSITAASNGRIYFSIGTHNSQYAARVYAFDPESEKIGQILDLAKDMPENPHYSIPHGKIHTPLVEWNGYLYFTTHTSVYDGSLPDLKPADGRAPYPGGYFVRMQLESGKLEHLAKIPLSNEGLITMELDEKNALIYGLTWPGGILFQYDLKRKVLNQYGATQGRGEWGQIGQDWSFICRRLGITPNGKVFGSSDDGRIWVFNPEKQRPVTFFSRLNLEKLPDRDEEDFIIEPVPHDYWRNWRTLLWNPNTESFWGLHGGSTQLFEFNPFTKQLRSVANLRVPGLPATRKNPLRTQLGFILGPDNTLYYLAHGPSLHRKGRRDTKANTYLLSYQIDTGHFINHGPVIGPGDERVFFSESLCMDPNGYLYSIAWVEILDPERIQLVQETRGDGLPTETRDIVYEIQLIQLPNIRELHPTE